MHLPSGPSQRTSQAASPQLAGDSVEATRSAKDVNTQYCDVRRTAQHCGLPVEPFGQASTKSLKDHMEPLFNDASRPTGAFKTRISRSRKTQGKKGHVCRLSCSERDNGCLWSVDFEYTTDGWTLFAFENEHNHELAHSQVEAIATGLAYIPSDFEDLGFLLADAGLPAKDIMNVFVTKCRRDGVEQPPFTYEQVYNKFVRKSVSQRSLDANGLVERLAIRKQTTGLQYFVDADEECRLDRLFAECVGATTVWGTARKVHVVRNVLFFDPTWGTNCFGLKLSLFITVTNEGETRILAYLLHHEESHDDVFWGLRCFHKVFKHPPASLLTDSAIGILKAVEKFVKPEMPWFGTAHLLCIFHIDQNFYQHIHPLFAGNADKWQEAHNMFWRIVQDSDESVRPVIFGRLKVLRTFVETHGRGKTKADALAWMDNILKARLDKWAGCFTWWFFSTGSHATSRSESTNACVKRALKANSSLCDLHTSLDEYTQFKEFRDSCKLHSTIARTVNSFDVKSSPWFIQDVQPLVTAYAFKLLLSQLAQVLAYRVTPVPANDTRSDAMRGETPGTNFLVTRVSGGTASLEVALTDTGTTSTYDQELGCGIGDVHTVHWTSATYCSCGFLVSFGVPCRHIICLRVAEPLTGTTPLVELFEELWRIRPTADLVVGVEDNSDAASGEADEDDDDDFELIKPSACYANLAQVIRTEGKQAMHVSKQERTDWVEKTIKNYDGYFMALKYGSKDQGGWHVAKMTGFPAGTGEMNLHFPNERDGRQEARWLCDISLMIKTPLDKGAKYPARSWLLLEEYELQAPISGIANPSSSRGPGRSRTSRGKSLALPPHKR